MHPAIPVASFRSRKHFHLAIKSSNESVTDWYARIHSMAESCQYGDASGIQILDKFIVGLDDELFDRICTEVGYLSLEQSMKLAVQLEEEFNLLPVRSHEFLFGRAFSALFLLHICFVRNLEGQY